jgi:outer membrane protein assembly factor BamB
MKKFLIGVTLGMAATVAATADDQSTRYTRPPLPSRQALDRLHLTMAWHVYVATDGRRDGLFSVQLIDDQVLVQNRSGIVTLLDARDGSTIWRTMVGSPFEVSEAMAYNKTAVFAIRGGFIYALDRKSGKVRWKFSLPHGVSAPPAADDTLFYLCLLTREVYAYDLPETLPPQVPMGLPSEIASSSPSPGTASGYPNQADQRPVFQPAPRAGEVGPQPRYAWTYSAETRLEKPILQTQDLLAVSGVAGIFFGLNKENGKPAYRFTARAAVSAPLGQWGNVCYMGSQDFNLYALDIVGGRFLWRFVGGAPILVKPQVSDEDIFLSPANAGLYRIDRKTGEQVWHNRRADLFLAQNKKFVYATDSVGRLLVLDRARGTQLSVYNAREFVVHVPNEVTDRLYLASNDGLIVCLHDRDYPKPLAMKQVFATSWAQPIKPKEGEAKPKQTPAKPKPAEQDQDNSGE